MLLGVTEGKKCLGAGDVEGLSERQEEDWIIGKELIRTCVDTYEKTATGLAPEIVHFVQKREHINRFKNREWIIPRYNRLRTKNLAHTKSLIPSLLKSEQASD